MSAISSSVLPSNILLTHFSPVSHFHTPWKRQKTKGFRTFSGGIEMWHWTKMGQYPFQRLLLCRPLVTDTTFHYLPLNSHEHILSRSYTHYLLPAPSTNYCILIIPSCLLYAQYFLQPLRITNQWHPTSHLTLHVETYLLHVETYLSNY